MGDPEVPDSWLQPDPGQADTTHLGNKLADERFLSVPLPLCLCNSALLRKREEQEREKENEPPIT